MAEIEQDKGVYEGLNYVTSTRAQYDSLNPALRDQARQSLTEQQIQDRIRFFKQGDEFLQRDLQGLDEACLREFAIQDLIVDHPGPFSEPDEQQTEKLITAIFGKKAAKKKR